MLLLALWLLACGVAAALPGADGSTAEKTLPVGEGAWERVQRYNHGRHEALFAPQTLDSLLLAERELPTAMRLGLWARRFAASRSIEYRFGLHEGGYVAEGLLVSDRRQDCVSLLYRCSELAQAFHHRDALAIALAIRFPGAPLDSLVDSEGRVDYERPEHLDFSLDMIRSGLWGRHITTGLSGATTDERGTARYPAGSFEYVPTATLDLSELCEGDVCWLVLSPAHEGARRLREEYGLAIGHIGLLIEEEGEILLVHAASSGLEGVYEGGRVLRVPLQLYLERVERFCGVMITRF